MDAEQRKQLMAKITVKAWTDEDYKKRLLSNPKEILEEEGFLFPEKFDSKIIFHEDTNHVHNFVLPATPSSIEITEDELMTLAAQRLSIQLELF